jgi:hypothetical protein
MAPLAEWLQGSALAAFVAGAPWVWPVCETLHFIGLALVVGAAGLIDLRLLGGVKQLPFAPLHGLARWAAGGFGLNLITGAVFFAADSARYVDNVAFRMKMLFILLAGVNVIVFYLAVFPRVEALPPGGDAPRAARAIAAISLFLWVGVMFWGRLIPFV